MKYLELCHSVEFKFFFFLSSTSKNKFVRLALESTIAVASEISGVASVVKTLSNGIDIGVVGDNDFYSQREKVGEKMLFHPKFNN